MRCAWMERNPGRRGYELLLGSDYQMSYLWHFMSDIGDLKEDLLELAESSDMSMGTSAFYLFTDEPNVYIGFSPDKFTSEQRLAMKDNDQYFFRTSKLSFAAFLRQWVVVYDQKPHGIFVQETAHDVWQVQPMTESQVERIRWTGKPSKDLFIDESIEVDSVNFESSFDHHCDGDKNIVGGCWDRNGHLKKVGVLKMRNIISGARDCYEGQHVKLLTQSLCIRKSYFGDNWTAEQMAKALCKSFEDIVQIQRFRKNLWSLTGRADAQLEIKMFATRVDQKLRISMFYPNIP